MIYMILFIPNCIELNDFKKSYDHPCMLSNLIEVVWFQKRIFMGFQRVKLWVEFSIWIWYSKTIIELFKRFYWVYEIYWDYEFWGVMLVFTHWVESELSPWVMWPLSHEMSYYYELSIMSTWVLSSFELWVILLSCWLLKFFLLYVLWDFWVFLWDCWHSTESIIRWDSVRDSYIMSIDVR